MPNRLACRGRLDFAPATRLDYAINKQWTVALEEYDDFGAIRNFQPADQQYHQLFAEVDHPIGKLQAEAGAGFGLTPGGDKLTLKLILSSDLNGPEGIFSGSD